MIDVHLLNRDVVEEAFKVLVLQVSKSLQSLLGNFSFILLQEPLELCVRPLL